MNNEEIEELKEFTIDLTDIDELALGLEICSKKSNMVIQEFIDSIIQLQQENQKLKNQLDEYKRLGFEHLNNKCNKLENQQKEFIEYMNKTIEELECDDVGDEELKCCLIQRIDIFKEILLNYKSIMGVSKYKESGEQ